MRFLAALGFAKCNDRVVDDPTAASGSISTAFASATTRPDSFASNLLLPPVISSQLRSIFAKSQKKSSSFTFKRCLVRISKSIFSVDAVDLYVWFIFYLFRVDPSILVCVEYSPCIIHHLPLESISNEISVVFFSSFHSLV